MASLWCFWISHRIILADTQIDFPGFEDGWYQFLFEILDVFCQKDVVQENLTGTVSYQEGNKKNYCYCKVAYCHPYHFGQR